MNCRFLRHAILLVGIVTLIGKVPADAQTAGAGPNKTTAPHATTAAGLPGTAFQEERIARWQADSISLNDMRINADGTTIAVPLDRQGRWSIAVNGRPGPEYDDFARESIVFSPDGKRMAYTAKKGGEFGSSGGRPPRPGI